MESFRGNGGAHARNQTTHIADCQYVTTRVLMSAGHDCLVHALWCSETQHGTPVVAIAIKLLWCVVFIIAARGSCKRGTRYLWL